MSDQALLLIASRLLAQGRIFNALSLGVTLIALATAVYAASSASTAQFMLCVAAVLLGLLQCYLAMRTAFDAALFEALSAAKQLDSRHMQSFDAAMMGLNLMPIEKSARDWKLRCQGALRLLRWQIGFSCLQPCLFLLGLAPI